MSTFMADGKLRLREEYDLSSAVEWAVFSRPTKTSVKRLQIPLPHNLTGDQSPYFTDARLD